MSIPKPYVLVESFKFGDNEIPERVLATWDRELLTRETGWDALERSRRQHPERYGPHGEYRLVLLGPDRSVLPHITDGQAVDDLGERPAQPGERCTCGRPAVKVFLGAPFGDTGYCGVPDGGQRPCPWCGAERHTGRCPRYTLAPSQAEVAAAALTPDALPEPPVDAPAEVTHIRQIGAYRHNLCPVMGGTATYPGNATCSECTAAYEAAKDGGVVR